MKVGVRTFNGEKRLYTIDEHLPHDEVIKIVKAEIPVAKTVLVEITKEKPHIKEFITVEI